MWFDQGINSKKSDPVSLRVDFPMESSLYGGVWYKKLPLVSFLKTTLANAKEGIFCQYIFMSLILLKMQIEIEIIWKQTLQVKLELSGSWSLPR